jgi:hypothetical protein
MSCAVRLNFIICTARPARTWFQSEHEKTAVREAAAAAVDGAASPAAHASLDSKRGEAHGKKSVSKQQPHRLNRRKRRRLEASAALDAEERRIARVETQGKREAAGHDEGGSFHQRHSAPSASAPFKLDKATLRVKKAIESTHHIHASAKKVKSAVRERAVESGMAISAVERMQRKAKGAKGAKTSRKPGPRSDFDDAEPSSVSRGFAGQKPHGSSGKFTGKSASFKSKARFKRR